MKSSLKDGLGVLRSQGALPLVSQGVLKTGKPLINTVSSRYPGGTNIFERDWDLLIILDACRVDTLRNIAGEIPFISNVDSMRSVGSHSMEWALNTFRKKYIDEIKNTIYICRNSLPDKILAENVKNERQVEINEGIPKWSPVSSKDFAHYELVRPIANHSEEGLHPDANVVPHIATDRAIAVGRKIDFDRMILHLNSPHLRYITGGIDWTQNNISDGKLMNGFKKVRNLKPEEKSWGPAKRGEVSRSKMMRLYTKELKFILDYVSLLLDNIDAEEVVISADHGEAFGEWGLWGHHFGWPFAPQRRVPWAKTEARDKHTYEPRFDPVDRNESDEEYKQFLKDMGYL